MDTNLEFCITVSHKSMIPISTFETTSSLLHNQHPGNPLLYKPPLTHINNKTLNKEYISLNTLIT